jgi:ERCC4-type nuclease
MKKVDTTVDSPVDTTADTTVDFAITPINVGISLIIDTRERAVIPFIDSTIISYHHQIKQITVGDFAICCGNKLLAVFERKTLADFAASLQDSRYDNVKKMIKVREDTGCQLYYIIEGPAFPNVNKKFHHIQYSNILAAITALMVRDNIFIVHTENEMHTAKRLSDFCRGFTKYFATGGAASSAASGAAMLAAPTIGTTDDGAMGSDVMSGDATDGGATGSDVTPLDRLTLRTEPTIEECVINMWLQLRGISVVLAKILSSRFTIAQFMQMPLSEILDMKTATGRKLHKDAIKSLTALRGGSIDVAARLLSGIKNITVQVADSIVTQIGGLEKLTTADLDTIAAIPIQQKTRVVKLGTAKANKIILALTSQ